MTSETRTLIDLKDVLAIEYQCGVCGSRFSIPITKKDIDHPMVCPHCSAEWHGVADAYHRKRFIELTRALFQSAQSLVEMQTNETQPIKLNVRLEIATHENKLA